MIKALIFDLDDTLYYELDYVKSGFQAVSYYLNQKFGVSRENCYQELNQVLETAGRGKTFNIALKRFNLPDDEVEKMVTVYRSHQPELQLYDDAVRLLHKLNNDNTYQSGIITDGNSEVQWNKIKSLGLNELVDEIIVTDDFGVDRRKPHVFPYQKMLSILRVKADEAVYIGDNPLKDFITARDLGMKTVRIIRKKGMHINKRLTPQYEADLEIKSLDEIEDILK